MWPALATNGIVCQSVCLSVILSVLLYIQVMSVIPDQDTFYDVSDALEDQGLERIIQQTCKSCGVRSDIVEEFRRYESALKHEDDVETSRQHLDLIENVRYVMQNVNLRPTNCLLFERTLPYHSVLFFFFVFSGMLPDGVSPSWQCDILVTSERQTW